MDNNVYLYGVNIKVYRYDNSKCKRFSSQSRKVFSMVNSGEHVILKSREGSFRLVPVTPSDSVSEDTQNIAADLKGALRELKDVIAGKKQLNTLDKLINEL